MPDHISHPPSSSEAMKTVCNKLIHHCQYHLTNFMRLVILHDGCQPCFNRPLLFRPPGDRGGAVRFSRPDQAKRRQTCQLGWRLQLLREEKMKLIAWRESDDGDLAETEQKKKKWNTIKKIITKPSTPPCCPVCLLFLLKDIQGLKRHVTASLSFQVPCNTWHHKATASRKQESATSFLQYSDPFF